MFTNIDRPGRNSFIGFLCAGALSLAVVSFTWADSPKPTDGAQSNASSGNVATDEFDVDEDEALLIEMRRRALEAELAEEEGFPVQGAGELAMTIADLDSMPQLPGNLACLPTEPRYPEDNQPPPHRIELGKNLYFDKRLSRDGSMSCATCHDPNKGWADALPRAAGFGGKELGRHSPTVINTAFNEVQFWDGRAATLEEQAVGPIMAAGEMNMPGPEVVLELLRKAPEYSGAFEAAYGSGPSMDNIGRAIAAFERTVITGQSPFDRYVAGDKSALTESQKRGLILFTTTASCTACHNGINFTDNKFHSLGVQQAGPLASDLGRFEVSNDPKDKHAFKTPGLRNIEQSAPYMHDGSLATLEDVVEFYNKGGLIDNNRSRLIQPLNLTESQKQDLVEFLRSLTGPLPQIEVPAGLPFGV